MQEFFINHGSLNPVLEMELIKDGRFDFQKSLINNALQDSTVTFSMRNVNTGLLKISQSKASIVLANTNSCEEKYILQYKWQERDVREKGTYKGWFEIKFNGDIVENNIEYPTGNLIVPIEEDLLIVIK